MSNLLLYESMLKALMQQIQPYNYHLIFMPVQQRCAPESLLDGRLDGCVVLGSCGKVLTEALQKTRGAVVLVNTQIDMDFPQIGLDDVTGTRLAMEHLFEQGHQRIVFFQGVRKAYHTSVEIRTQAYRQMMQDKTLSEHIQEWETMPASDVVARYQQSSSRPTAIVVYNSDSAVELLQAFWLQDIRVPEDVSVITFNDTRDAEIAIPPLTTVAAPLQDMGKQAARLLLEQLGDIPASEKDQQAIRDPWLVVRQSVRCLAT